MHYRFQEMTRLYHFTTVEAAFKIIQSGKLRFGKQYRKNDLLESNKIAFEYVLSEEAMEQYNSFFAEEEMRNGQGTRCESFDDYLKAVSVL